MKWRVHVDDVLDPNQLVGDVNGDGVDFIAGDGLKRAAVTLEADSSERARAAVEAASCSVSSVAQAD